MTIPLIPAFPSHITGVTAFFTTREGGLSPPPYHELNLGYYSGEDQSVVERNWKRLLGQEGLSFEHLKIPKLEHTDVLCEADPCGPHASFPVADAVCTQNPDDVLAVTAADCLPVLIFDPVCRTVAAVHAGRRGSAGRILEKALKTLHDRQKIKIESVLLSFGPRIHSEHYPVSGETAALFPKSCIKEGRPGVYCLDLLEVNLGQALGLGIPEPNLFTAPHCVFEQSSRFYSYRRDGKHTGRMAAVVKLA